MGKLVSLLALAPLLLACGPSAVDYAALRSAAAERQRAAGFAPSKGDASVSELVAKPLTAESAAQIALLNNHGVRAVAEELGIAEGRASHARRLPNPTLEGAMRFDGADSPELDLGAMIDLSALLLLASRSAAASDDVDAAKLRAIGAMLDLSFEARRAFYDYQAAAELVALRRTVLSAFDASADLATRLREAGNITELDLANQQSLFEEARLELRSAELAEVAARERVNKLLGLWGRGVSWRAEPRLPEPPKEELSLASLEKLAVERSLELAESKHRFAAADRRAGVARAQGFLPELKAGVSAERTEQWTVGPAVEIEVPLFYQGQGEVAAAQAEMRQQQNLYADAAVGVRSAARDLAARLSAQRETALYYKNVVLPLKQKVVEQSQLEYNGMLIGLFQLLQAKRDQVRTAAAYVEALRAYWTARMGVEQLLSGRLPAEMPRGGQSMALPASERAADGH